MDEEELLEEAELADRDVGRAGGLESLDSRDTDTNVCCLDHADVVGAVADREQVRHEVFLHQLDDEGFLEGRNST